MNDDARQVKVEAEPAAPEREEKPLPGASWLDRPLVEAFSLNLEQGVYLVLLLLAVATRFWDLGARAMSHDESLHALFSWKLYRGEGYAHDPMMHGPFLFHANALIYFLFGVSDYTARIVPALFGVAMVGLPYLFRRWMGRAGALMAAVLILVSPSLLYYSRYIRNDIYITVWTLLLAFSLFSYVRDHRPRWLTLASLVLILSIATKEVAFITAFIGLTFVALVLVWERASERARSVLQLGSGGAALGLVALVVALHLATRPDPTGAPSLAVRLTPNLMFVSLLLAAALAATLFFPRDRRQFTEALRLLNWERLRLPLIVFVAVYVVLFTTFFTNPRGIVTGSVGAIGYWLAQQPVQRGSQPWYYYFFLMPFYDLAPFFVGLPALGYLMAKAARRRLAADLGDGYWLSFLAYWAITSLVIYSWAGEKMPWLVVHPVLPLLFIAAQVVGRWLSAQDWQSWLRRGGLTLSGLLVLMGAALLVMIRVRPLQGFSLSQLNATGQWLGALAVLAVLGWLSFGRARQLGTTGVANSAKVLGLSLILALTVRFAWMASYINYDLVNEFLVYAHGTPDIKLVMSQIEEISRRITGGNELAFSYDQEDVWPLEWYVKDYPNRIFYGNEPTKTAMEAPVVIVNSDNEAKAKPLLGDRYFRFQHRVVWWPVESYKNLTPARILDVLRDRDRLDTWLTIWLYRRHPTPFSDWPYQNRFALYIRKDVLNQMWDLGVTLAIPAEMPPDPYQEVWREMPASLVVGSQGQEEGRFTQPRGVAVAPDGNVYVVDSGNHRVQVFTPQGQFLHSWGGPGNGPGQFTEPWGIAVAPNGDVYVADTWNHRVQWFSARGDFQGMWGYFADAGGNLQASPGGFWGPRDLVVDSEGYVYVTDTGNKRIQKFTAQGEFVAVYGSGDVAGPGFDEPVGLAEDGAGNYFVADTWNRRIVRLDRSFRFVDDWPVESWEGESVMNKPYLAADSQYIYAADPEAYRILVFDHEGEIVLSFGRYGTDAAGMNLPTGLALDREGRLWVTDSANHRLLRFSDPRP
ncbi:MAG: TIGR03663 family protein [Anaerolineae bacterium]|nr:TIGR03663 family protein [Anaerolineae bacterium]